MTRHLILLLSSFSILAGCAKEPPARSVTEFVENPMLLEAAMIRCAQDRSGTRYDAECLNARQAVDRVQAREEAAREAELEASSERKRKALRRTQAAVEEARRRAQRAQEEAAYLAEYGLEHPDAGEPDEPLPEGNLPVAVVPEAAGQPLTTVTSGEVPMATDGGNAPVAQPQPEPPESGSETP